MQRITVILGAGAMVDATDVSTSSISKEVFKIIERDSGGESGAYSSQNLKRFLLNQMYDLASKSEYKDTESKNASKWEDRIASKVNFEEYFNILELLQSYCLSYIFILCHFR